MSCPYIPGNARNQPLPADLTGEHGKLTTAFEMLLPNCKGPQQRLEDCRMRVAKAGYGHCAPESQCFSGHVVVAIRHHNDHASAQVF